VLAKVLPVFLFIPLKSHNLVATTTAYGLFPQVSIHLYVHHPNTSRGQQATEIEPLLKTSVSRQNLIQRTNRSGRSLGGTRICE
jgi:hypothetical protein